MATNCCQIFLHANATAALTTAALSITTRCCRHNGVSVLEREKYNQPLAYPPPSPCNFLGKSLSA